MLHLFSKRKKYTLLLRLFWLFFRGCSWDGTSDLVRLRHPDSFFLQCRGMGTATPPPPPPAACWRVALLEVIWQASLPLPTNPDFVNAQTPRGLGSQVFSSFSLLGFFKLFLAYMPSLFLRWGEWPRTPSASQQFLPTVPGDGNWHPPRPPPQAACWGVALLEVIWQASFPLPAILDFVNAKTHRGLGTHVSAWLFLANCVISGKSTSWVSWLSNIIDERTGHPHTDIYIE